MSGSSASATALGGCPRSRRASTAAASMRRRLRAPPRARARPATRRRTSPPAPPIVARPPAPWASARPPAHTPGAGPHTMPPPIQIHGKPVSLDGEARTTLADCLRHHLRLTGTHVGCEHGVCGACTVIVDGEAVRSCLLLAAQAEGSSVVTIEGLSNDEALTPLQASFR